MDVEAIVERIWPGQEARVEVLGGGITNHNFKVEVGGGTYVLRISGHATEMLGIDRSVEHDAALAAAAVGVGPEVVAFIEPEGYLVTRFIEGSIVPLERMREPEWIRRAAHALRAVHRGPSLSARFISFRVVDDYRTTAFAHGAEVPPSYAWARQVARRVERARGAFAERPCHNDLLNANFIDDGQRLRIVDWEYAGMGDVFFDLANFAVNHELDRDARQGLLEAYLGAVEPSGERALELMLFMSDFREAMWGVVQGAVSELDFDFRSYAAEHFERMEATAASPSFVAALERG
jgi:thiamine kinase-like enzyme